MSTSEVCRKVCGNCVRLRGALVQKEAERYRDEMDLEDAEDELRRLETENSELKAALAASDPLPSQAVQGQSRGSALSSASSPVSVGGGASVSSPESEPNASRADQQWYPRPGLKVSAFPLQPKPPFFPARLRDRFLDERREQISSNLQKMDAWAIANNNRESDTSDEEVECGKRVGGMCGPYEDFEGWRRTPVPMDSSRDTSNFRFWATDSDFGLTSTANIPLGLIPVESIPRKPRLPLKCKEQSYIRLYGVTESGNSVCCNTFGFLPYFYALPSVGFYEEYVQQLKTLLTNAIIERTRKDLNAVAFHGSPVISVEILDGRGENVFGLHLSSVRSTGDLSLTPMCILKITCAVPKLVWAAAGILKGGEITFPGITEPCTYEVYESSINHNIRFLTDLNLSTCTWLEIKAGSYSFHDANTRLSHCQVELDVYWEDVRGVSAGEDLYDITPPLRILSFDIECMTRPRDFLFPKEGSDLVLQIGNVVATHGSLDPPRRVVFALGQCSKSEATEIISFEKEEAMLGAWRSFVLATDPDIITGYNIRKFDLPYLLRRARKLKLDYFAFLGRVKKCESNIRLVQPGPKRMYAYDEKKVDISGRIVLDMFPLMMRHNTNPGQCSLAQVAARYLKTERKINVHYTQIFKMQNLSKDSRRDLAEYCIQDSLLPYLLIRNHNPNPVENPNGNMLSYYVERARSTGIPLRYLVGKSKAYASFFGLVRTQKNPSLPHIPITPSPAKLARRRRASDTSILPSPKRLDFEF